MIEYTLIRSDRRTLGLEITPDLTVVVRAPRRCRQPDIDRFVAAHGDWIDRHLEVQRRRQAARAARQVTPEQEAELRRRAVEIIPQRVAVYAARMGVTPTGVRITGAQKRFGSCSGKNSLCFSWRLMQYPMEAVDYVVVHELCHIQVRSHGPDFYALLAQYLPDYKERKKLLK